MSLQDEGREVGEARRVDLREQRRHVDPAVCGGEGPETTRRLLELTLAADPPPAAGLVPGDRHVNQALEEVALPGGGCAPGLFERLVGREVLAGAQQLESLCERRLHRYLFPSWR